MDTSLPSLDIMAQSADSTYQVFISHSSDDKGIARDLCNNLEAAGFKCWIAPRDIPAGSMYEEGIMNGICECPVFVLVCTSAINGSTFVPDEINAAKRRDKIIIPLIFEEKLMFPPALELLLSRYQWLDLWEYENLMASMPIITKSISEYVSPRAVSTGSKRSLKRSTEKAMGPSIQSSSVKVDPNGIDAQVAEAKKGDIWAQYTVARMYGSGYNVNESYGEAVKWYKLASDNGHLMARSVLHSLVPSEKDVSDEELAEWMTENAERFISKAEEGNAIAQCDTGWMYQYGKGRKQSYIDAVVWYKKSALQGYARAQNIIGVMYQNGQGVEQSYDEAVKWYKKAAEQNYARAQYHLGLLCESGDGIEQSYITASEYYTRAANQGHPMAQNNLAYLYQNGLGVEQSEASALTWYNESASNGYAIAQFNLGMMYLNGIGVDESYADAAKWFTKAAEQNHVSSLYNLAVLYESGYGVDMSIDKAIELYKRAADLGDEDAKAAYADLTS